MDSSDFRRHGKEMVDFIADYCDSLRDRKVSHSVTPNYMRKLLPAHAPEDGESYEDIMEDVDKVIMPGTVHWRSPKFHGYFACGGSFPSLLGDMLSDALGCIGFSWASSPACTELEMTTTNWLGQAIGLPKQFLHSDGGQGGGVIQTTASETTLLCLMAARDRKVKVLQTENPDLARHEVTSRLVCYTSDQANASVHRASLMASIAMRKLPTDKTFGLRGNTFLQAVTKDMEKGLIPLFLCATLGTTPTCALDDLSELGPICKREDIWLHVDAAYAGSAFVCPEYRNYLQGIEHAETVSVNPHKWMLTHFDLSVLWIQHNSYITQPFNVDPLYLKHTDQKRTPDFRHWQIPLGRRFRSLKLWFVLRSYGLGGIRKYIRGHIQRAKQFADLLDKDGRFELPAEVIFGLVCFRIKGSNKWTEKLLDVITEDGEIFLVPSNVYVDGKAVFFLRFAVVAEQVTSEDIRASFKVVKRCTDQVFQRRRNPPMTAHLTM